MKIKMLQARRANPSSADAEELLKNEIYDLPDALATALLTSGEALPVREPTEQPEDAGQTEPSQAFRRKAR